jgi:hypothetical protein
MQLIRIPFDDRAEPNLDGTYDWIYSGQNLVFRDGTAEVVFRCYSDEPNVAYLLGSVSAAATVLPLLTQAVALLRAHEAVASFKALDPARGSYQEALVAVSSAASFNGISQETADVLGPLFS